MKAKKYWTDRLTDDIDSPTVEHICVDEAVHIIVMHGNMYSTNGPCDGSCKPSGVELPLVAKLMASKFKIDGKYGACSVEHVWESSDELPDMYFARHRAKLARKRRVR